MIRKLLLTALSIAAATPAAAMTGYSPADETRAALEFRIGADLVQHRRYDEAVPHLDRALDQWPDDVHVLDYLAAAHRAIGERYDGNTRKTELKLAATYYRRILVEDLNGRNFLDYMGEYYLSLDDPAAARTELDALTRECAEGCPEQARLAAALAAYVPPKPAPLPAP
ncbi:MAG: hypothetical protein JOZ13_10210 [Alphaproteobacteria bacterium]|nr:hypothetical protein [Alphaproteobacteria bacterium]